MAQRNASNPGRKPESARSAAPLLVVAGSVALVAWLLSRRGSGQSQAPTVVPWPAVRNVPVMSRDTTPAPKPSSSPVEAEPGIERPLVERPATRFGRAWLAIDPASSPREMWFRAPGSDRAVPLSYAERDDGGRVVRIRPAAEVDDELDALIDKALAVAPEGQLELWINGGADGYGTRQAARLAEEYGGRVTVVPVEMEGWQLDEEVERELVPQGPYPGRTGAPVLVQPSGDQWAVGMPDREPVLTTEPVAAVANLVRQTPDTVVYLRGDGLGPDRLRELVGEFRTATSLPAGRVRVADGAEFRRLAVRGPGTTGGRLARIARTPIGWGLFR